MRGLIVAAMLLLGGCIEGPPPDAAKVDETANRVARDRQGNGTEGRYDNAFPLLIYPDGTGGTACIVAVGCVDKSNCIRFGTSEFSDFALTNGTVVLSWVPVSPLAETLVLTAIGSQSLSIAGRSPLELTFERLVPAGVTGIEFGVDHELPNVPLDQKVSIHVVFDYAGDLPTAERVVCRAS